MKNKKFQFQLESLNGRNDNVVNKKYKTARLTNASIQSF